MRKMLTKLREWDRTEEYRRLLKVVRNLFVEPPPRSRELVFRRYCYAYPEIRFIFEVDGKEYTSRAFVDEFTKEQIAAVDPRLWVRVITAVGMAMAPFHFLLADFASVRLEFAYLTNEAKTFYQDYFRAGLAELRYRQGLNPNREIRVFSSSDQAGVAPVSLDTDDKILMLNGGGKDTAVMAELLRETGQSLAWASINLSPRQTGVANVSGIRESYNVRFEIDPAIRQDARYPWGHVPFTALFMCLGLIPAIIGRFRYVTTGNEYSANFGNMFFRCIEINHQYSKSHAYETAFNEYLENNVVRGVKFFSALRPFYEIRIAAMLSQLPQYLDSFVSCNKGSHWCNDCPKCAFIFLALAPFIELERLVSVFGENLIEKRSIRLYLLDLLSGRVKPWECVGTQGECQLAMKLTLAKFPDMDFDEFPYRADLTVACGDADVAEFHRKYLLEMNSPDNIPHAIRPSIEQAARRLIPA